MIEHIARRAGLARLFVIAGALVLAGCANETAGDGDGKAASAAQGGADEAGAPSAAEAGDAAAKDAADTLPEAEAILAKAVAAVGGEASLKAIESFYYEGKIEILGQNIAGDVKIWWKNGDFYTEQEMTGIGKVRAGKQGDEVWAEDPITGLRKLEGAEAEQHMWASSLQLAADWQRYFQKATTIGEREDGGATLHDVELVAESGGKVTMTFDAESGLQVAQTFKQVTPLGELPVTVKMEDYRDVDGVKIAFKQITDANLMKATQTITKIEINPQVSDSRFAMPRSGAEVVKKP